jgi:hypothetical protein
MVLIPPLTVYIHISTIVVATVTMKGTCQASKRNNCSTVAARYNLSEDPIVLEMRKKNAPVL